MDLTYLLLRTKSHNYSHRLILLLLLGAAMAVWLGGRMLEDANADSTVVRSAMASESTCSDSLPRVEYLGEGAGSYLLGTDYDSFIVKQFNPFSFQLEDGFVDAAGDRRFLSDSDRVRVWACAGDCTFSHYYQTAHALGAFAGGTTVEFIVIDDDGPAQNDDQRINWWAVGDPATPYTRVTEQTMVEHLIYEIPVTGHWYFFAEDSIGISKLCTRPQATATPTVSATPSVTPTPSVTLTLTPTATDTTTPTPSATASPTPTVAATPTATSTATSTVAPTQTPTVTPTPTVEVRATAVQPPTAIDLLRFSATQKQGGVEILWESGSEYGVFGFHIWRSDTGLRVDARRITQTAVPAGGANGALYTYWDADAGITATRRYWLQEVGLDQSFTEYGPFSIRLLQLSYLPLIAGR